MREHIKHTIIYQKEHPAFVVIPYEEYQTLFDLDEEVEIPHEVVKLTVKYHCNLIGAWRRYRALSQSEFAKKMGVTQGAISQIEKSDRPHKSTIESAAHALDCQIAQLN